MSHLIVEELSIKMPIRAKLLRNHFRSGHLGYFGVKL